MCLQIAGRLIAAPPVEQLREFEANEVLYEGEVYRFHTLHPDGAFELKKAW